MLTTIDSQGAAQDLAATLVESRLPACVQIVPVASVYRREGRMRRDAEYLLPIETAAPLAEIERLLHAQHSYQTPEIVRSPITGGSDDYLGSHQRTEFKVR